MPPSKFFLKGMILKKELPVIQKAYDLAKEILPRVSKFPRDHKFTLGDRITAKVLDTLENVIQAGYRKERKALLESANLNLEQLRFLLRLACELGSLSQNGFEHVMKLVTELGQQIGGWLKHSQSDHAQDF